MFGPLFMWNGPLKRIIIGKGGSMLKEVGMLARQDIEALLGSQVNLQLWVKVQRRLARESRYIK